MRIVIYACLFLASVNGTAQPSSYDASIRKIKSLISEHYINREKIKILSDSLGGINYKDLKPQDFVEKINMQLQRYSGDKHLRLEYNPDYTRRVKIGEDVKEDQRGKERSTNFGF